MFLDGKDMKFLFIGNGFISPKHKEAVEAIDGEIVSIVDLSQGENKWQEAIKESDADCVVVLTPNDLHYKITELALECGKKVICEKPLAINSKDAEALIGEPNVFPILQLRYHPDILKIKNEIKDKNIIEMDISVYRDENYYKGWKGQKERSGGVLFNLGVHYFDLLIHLFVEPKKVKLLTLDDKTGTGIIEGDNYVCNFKVSTGEKRENQRRIFKINGKQYNFSSQDNLSYENLHKFVYEDMINGKRVAPSEALKSIKLIENLYKSYEK